MKGMKKFFTSVPGLILIFTLAVLPLIFSSVGGARAALTYYSETYASQVEMFDIGVSLLENGTVVSNRDYYNQVADGSWNEHTGVLLANMLTGADGKKDKLAFNKKYTEELQAKNSGTIDTYVRVTLYKYWVDKDGNKTYTLSPSLIDLNLCNIAGADGDQCWIKEDAATTEERTVLYYNKLLPAGATTPKFTDTLSISGDIDGNISSYTKEDGTVVTTYNYNDYKFIVEATVDSVQDHNAEAAILSAWGKNVNISNQTLSLK